MDLVVAADLVSKTLGSSTNALSRYGIQVEGAVGSTERLESLTGNLAKVFGGQATEQSNTLAGALESMDNAIGDAQESIGEAMMPLMKAFAGATQNAAEAISDFITSTNQTKLESFIDEMRDLGMETDQYELSLKKIELNKALKNLKGDLVDSGDAQGELNTKLDRYKEVLQEGADIEIQRAAHREKHGVFGINMAGAEITMLEMKNIKEKDILEKRIEFLAKQVEIQTNLNKLKAEEQKLEDGIIKKGKDKSKSVEKVSALQRELANIQKQESAKAAKMEFENALNASKSHLIKQIMKSIPFPLNTILAAGAGASIDKIFTKNNIKAAQYGADFVTNGPQMMLVGEGSGPEHVQVTPLAGGDPNINGPQGGGMTINIQGSVIGTEEFTEEVLMPQIEEGLRLGNTI